MTNGVLFASKMFHENRTANCVCFLPPTRQKVEDRKWFKCESWNGKLQTATTNVCERSGHFQPCPVCNPQEEGAAVDLRMEQQNRKSTGSGTFGFYNMHVFSILLVKINKNGGCILRFHGTSTSTQTGTCWLSLLPRRWTECWLLLTLISRL